MTDENLSLLDFIKMMFENEVVNLDFGNFFPLVADSVLTSFLLFFIAGWIMSICISLGRRGWK